MSYPFRQAICNEVFQGWDFADALHHALSEGCDDFVTLDGDLVKRSKRTLKVSTGITRL